MEKLIQLLNQYERKVLNNIFYKREKWCWWKHSLFRRDTLDEDWHHMYSNEAEAYVISKKYGFIKWLVEKDKIDLRKLDYKVSDVDIPTRYYLWTYIRYSIENEILMSLAIQDNPIEFLISLLKNV